MNAPETPLKLPELLGRCMGEQDFAFSILESFLNTCDQQIKQIAELNERGSQEELAKLAHRFKGTAATVAAGPLTQTLTELEQMARAQIKSKRWEKEQIDSQIATARHEIIRLHEFYSINLPKQAADQQNLL